MGGQILLTDSIYIYIYIYIYDHLSFGLCSFYKYAFLYGVQNNYSFIIFFILTVLIHLCILLLFCLFIPINTMAYVSVHAYCFFLITHVKIYSLCI